MMELDAQELSRLAAMTLAVQLPCCVCGAPSKLTLGADSKARVLTWVSDCRQTVNWFGVMLRYVGLVVPLCDDCSRSIKTPADLRARVPLSRLMEEEKVAWWESDEAEFLASMPTERN